MNLSFKNILNNKAISSSNLFGKLGSLIGSGATPKFSELFKSVNQISVLLKQRQPSYDAVCEGMIAQSSLIDLKADEMMGETVEKTEQDKAAIEQYTRSNADDFVETTLDEVTALSAAINDACQLGEEQLNTAGDQAIQAGVTLSSSAGLVYEIVSQTPDQLESGVDGIIAYSKTRGTGVASVIRANGKYFINKYLYPLNGTAGADVVSDVTISLQQLLINCLNRMAFQVPEEDTLERLSIALAFQLGCDLSDINTISDAINASWAVVFPSSVIPEGSTLSDLCNDMVLGRVAREKYLTDDFKESFLSVSKSMVVSSEINTMLTDVCDSIIHGKIATLISGARSYSESKYNAIRHLWTRFVDAYNNGGLKGIISLIVSLFSSTQAINLGDNGIMSFTDNNDYRPAEYIAGMVGTIISTVITGIGMILSAFVPVVGVIVSAVGLIAGLVINSFKGDYSNTRASLYAPDSLEEAVKLLPCLPLVIANGTIDINRDQYLWYWWSYDRGNPVVVVDIPGGCFIVGPGAYVTKEDGTKEVSSIKWEVHVASTIYSQDVEIYQGINGFFTNAGTMQAHFNVANGGKENILKIYSILQSHVLDTITNASDGHLSEVDDKIAFSSFCINAWLIVTYLESLYFDGQGNLMQQPPNDGSLDRGGMFSTAFNFLGLATGTSLLPDSSDYSSMIDGLNTFLAYTLNHTVDRIGVYSGGEWVTMYQMRPRTFERKCEEMLDQKIFYGIPYSYVDGSQYDVILPKYNSATFWLWIALSAVVTAAITATVVIASVKFAQFKKFKRAANVSRFNDAQSAFQNAVNGRKEYFDPESGTYKYEEFDVNSSSGQAYIKSCYKQYKHVALSNNLWANIVGGSKYDVSSFWGEKDQTDDGSIWDSITTAEADLTDFTGDITTAPGSDEILSTNVAQYQSDELLVRLIKGPVVQ